LLFPTDGADNALGFQLVKDPGREFPGHPADGDVRMDFHQQRDRLLEMGNPPRPVLPGDVVRPFDDRDQPDDDSPHASQAKARLSTFAARWGWMRWSMLKQPAVPGFHDRLGAGVHPHHVLLFRLPILSSRRGRAERGGEDDHREVFRSSDDAADCLHFPLCDGAVHRRTRPLCWIARYLYSAWETRFRHVDVLYRDRAAPAHRTILFMTGQL